MNFIKKLIYNGEIPYFGVLKNIFKFVPLVGVMVFFDPKLYVIFGDLGWYALLFIVFSRPLADVFPRLGILRKLVGLRKEMGIISGVFILLHGIGFFLASKIPLATGLLSSQYYDFNTLFGWGMIGMYIGIILTITSNKMSQKFLGRNWKRLQRLTYLFFIFGAIHIAFFDPEKILPLSIVVGTWAVLWVMAWRKMVLLK